VSVAFAPDGTRLASADPDNPVRVWDLRRPGAQFELLTYRLLQNSVESIAFAPDGNSLVSAGDDHTIRLWDLRRLNTPPEFLHGDFGQVLSVAFAPPDSSRLASSGDDGIRVWDLRELEASPLVLRKGDVRSVAFSPDGNHLASGGKDNVIRIWPLWSAAADYLCTRVWRNLSMDEWRFYIGDDIQYERTCPNLPAGGSESDPYLRREKHFGR
jgi:WD40 repeat protein